MRGELFGVWPETWREIWVKLAKHPEYGDDLLSDLYRQLVPAPSAPLPPPSPEEYTDDGELVRPKDIEARDAYEQDFKTYVHKRAQYEEVVGDGQQSRSACYLALKEIIKSEFSPADSQAHFNSSDIKVCALLLSKIPNSTFQVQSKSNFDKKIIGISFPCEQQDNANQVVSEFLDKRAKIDLFQYNRHLNCLRDEIKRA